jgi:tetratricopeptide (TPR) repeat protein
MRRKKFNYPGEELQKYWAGLHRGDAEPFPSQARIARVAKSHAAIGRWVMSYGGAAKVAVALQDAWRAFHAGAFAQAIELGAEQGALGSAVANKAVAIQTLYVEKNAGHGLKQLQAAIERGEQACEQWPDGANVHYTLALVLGRYSQKISIVEALAAGYASRIRESLDRALEIEPDHAEAHVALGLYHAEIVSKIGALPARFTYGASAERAMEHFKRAIKLAPKSAIAHVEYARGLLLLDADAYREQVDALCSHAAALEPMDAMEQLDVERAQHRCKSLS